MNMLGKTLTGRYKIVKQLGGGGFSHTFIAEDDYLPDHPSCVIKQLKPASSQEDVLKLSRELFDKEAKVLYRLGKHDCIPSLLAHFEEDEEFFLAQELIIGDVLTQEIRRGHCLGEQYAIDFLIDILPTLDFVHQQQVIHRDIKPSNLIRRADDRRIVLIDFGAVKEVSTQPISQLGHTSSLVIGSPGYMPNEQYSGKTMFASDIYAIGMIVLQALTGLLPNQIPEDPITSEFCWRDRVTVSPLLADIIDKMVRFDFRQRYQSAQEVLTALQPLIKRSPPITDAQSLPFAMQEVGEQSVQEQIIAEISDDLEMSSDPVRAKKLLCLVCTGILENDPQRLNNFSFIELLQDIYQQYPQIESLKEELVKSVKTIAIQKQRQYLVVAKIIFNAVMKLYQTSLPTVSQESSVSPNPTATGQSSYISHQTNPPSQTHQSEYSVNHLVVNASSAQLVTSNAAVAYITEEEEANPVAEVESIPEILDQIEDIDEPYLSVLYDIEADIHQVRLKKLLLYAYQDIWENDLDQFSQDYWLALLRDLVSFMPDFAQLFSLVQEAVLRVSKPKEYAAIANLLLIKLEHLYPDSIAMQQMPVGEESIDLEPMAEAAGLSITPPESISLVPFDPSIVANLFDIRLELMRFTNSLRAKILLFSNLYYPFDPDRQQWQDLRSHTLDSLLRKFFYTYSQFDQAEKALWQTVRSHPDAASYDQSASYILQSMKSLYDQLDQKLMLHPATLSKSKSSQVDFGSDSNSDHTQPSLLFDSRDDEDTCQFAFT